MRKCLLALSFLSITSKVVAQGNITVTLSPGVCYGRVHTDPDTIGYASQGAVFRGKLGVSYDWILKENYALSAGAAFLSKGLGVQNKKILFEEYREIQYIQFPLLLKLFTSELDLDLRIYAQLGFGLSITVGSYIKELKEGHNRLVKKLRMGEISGLLGAGVEYHISLSTALFVGLSYQPALTSILPNEDDKPAYTNVMGYSDIITLDLGVKF
jgi:hypothetical protein